MTSEIEPRVPKNSFGPLFSRFYSFFSSHSKGHMRVYEYVAKDAMKMQPKRVLDVGCGPGMLLSTFLKMNPDATISGVDPSPSMVKIARKRLQEYTTKGKAFIEEGSSKNIPFQGNFDLIISSMSFHHWEDRGGSLKYLSEHLETNGHIAIYENHRESSGLDTGKAHHSLSISEAGDLNINGFRKEVKVEGDIISVIFSR